MPELKEFFEVGDDRELIGDSNCWGIVKCIGEEVESVDEMVFVHDSGLGEIAVKKIDGVGEEQ